MKTVTLPDTSTLSPHVAALINQTVEKRARAGFAVEYIRPGTVQPYFLAYASSVEQRDRWVANARARGEMCNIVVEGA